MCSRSEGFTMRTSRAAVDNKQVATPAGSTAGEALQRLTTLPVKLAQCVINSTDFWEIEVNVIGIYGRHFVFSVQSQAWAHALNSPLAVAKPHEKGDVLSHRHLSCQPYASWVPVLT